MSQQDAALHSQILLVLIRIPRDIKMLPQPWQQLMLIDPAVHITSAAHFTPALRDQTYMAADKLRHGNIKSASAQIIDQEQSLGIILFQTLHAL